MVKKLLEGLRIGFGTEISESDKPTWKLEQEKKGGKLNFGIRLIFQFGGGNRDRDKLSV